MKHIIHGSGFTIIELLVVMAMVMFLTLIIAFKFTGSTSSFELDNAHALISADIRKMVTWAQSGRIEETTHTVPFGYGIVFTPNSTEYTLYADIDGDHVYSGTTSSDVVIDSIDLHSDELVNNVQIIQCAPFVQNESGQQHCDVSIAIPNGMIQVNGIQKESIQITAEHQKTGKTTVVQLNGISGKLE